MNWYCRLSLEERTYGQGTAVAVILAVRLCLPFIWTFSCLSFRSFVCFLFTPPVVLCHNKVSYPLPPILFSSFFLMVDFAVCVSTSSFFSPPPLGWSRDGTRPAIRLCVMRVVCGGGYVSRSVSEVCDVSGIALLMRVCVLQELHHAAFYLPSSSWTQTVSA